MLGGGALSLAAARPVHGGLWLWRDHRRAIFPIPAAAEELLLLLIEGAAAAVLP